MIDGLEPVHRASQSIQLQLFDYIYHQILRKDPDWVAQELNDRPRKRLAFDKPIELIGDLLLR